MFGTSQKNGRKSVFPTKENLNLPMGSTKIMFGFVEGTSLSLCIHKKGAMLEERL